MFLLKNYIELFRKELREDKKSFEEEFFGDGILNHWTCKYSPVIEPIMVSSDGAVVSPDYYSIDYTNGEITFTNAPEDGTVIGIKYKYVNYDDETLVYYLGKAVDVVESLYSLGYSTFGSGINMEVSNEPTNELKNLWIKVGKYLIKKDDLMNDMEGAQNWRDGGVSVNEVQNINMRKQLLDDMWEKILWDLERLVLAHSGGKVKNGGANPLSHGEANLDTITSIDGWDF